MILRKESEYDVEERKGQDVEFRGGGRRGWTEIYSITYFDTML